jgi:hypothetical protein
MSAAVQLNTLVTLVTIGVAHRKRGERGRGQEIGLRCYGGGNTKI